MTHPLLLPLLFFLFVIYRGPSLILRERDNKKARGPSRHSDKIKLFIFMAEGKVCYIQKAKEGESNYKREMEEGGGAKENNLL